MNRTRGAIILAPDESWDAERVTITVEEQDAPHPLLLGPDGRPLPRAGKGPLGFDLSGTGARK